jgi:ABC-2 type transport system permease protein
VPVYPLQFTRWDRPRLSSRWAWWQLAAASLRVRRGSVLMRRVRTFWFIYFSVFLVATYLAARKSEIAFLRNLLAQGPEAETNLAVILDAPTRLFTFLATPLQVLFLLIVALYAGAGLIAEDRRTGALALYLSKPVSRVQYVLSRVVVVAVYTAMFTLLPALGLLLFGILISENTLVALKDLRLVPGLVAYWLVLTILFGLPVLVLSSLTRRGRTAGVVLVILAALGLFAGGLFDGISGARLGSLVDIYRLTVSAGVGLLGPETNAPLGLLGVSAKLSASPWLTLPVILVYAALGLGILYVRTRAGEENR